MWNDITVVVPTYNGDPAHLAEALHSIANQTLDSDRYCIIVVDDASDDPEALAYLEQLEAAPRFEGVRLQVIRHEQNQWLAQARTTGARAATTPFVQFLDDDDYLAPDFLEKALVLLTATPEAAWVYSNVLKFGQRNEFYPAKDFTIAGQVFRNDTPYASLFRRDVWLEVGQREVFLNQTTRLFEDWDTYVRLVAKGHFGVPMGDSTFFYRRGSSGLAYRSVREYAASIYMMYRLHLWRLPAFPRAWLRLRRFRRLGSGELRTLSPTRLANRLVARFAGRYLHTYEFPAVFSAAMIRAAVLDPERFVSQLVEDRDTASLALLRSGFVFAPDMSFTHDNPFPDAPQTDGMLAGHIWWQMGGAENIYWHWLSQAKAAGVSEVHEVVQTSTPDKDVLKATFAEVVDQQFAFDGFGQTPLQHLRGLWSLICLKRPRIIFISSNSYLYYLAPHIKREFPEIKIVDILHNEFDGIVDWFTISADFDQSLDARIVTSQYWKDLLVQKYSVDEHKIVVADNPVDTELYDPRGFDREALHEEFGLDPAKRTVTFIGRLHHQKGLDVFLALAKQMANRRDYQFVIAGDGDLREQVIAAEKQSTNLHYLGYFPTVERVLAATDVLVCPSLYEGAPLIGLECAAMNTALVAPDIVGFREQLADGGFGATYTASMRPQMDALAIEKLIEQDYEGLLRRGKNGRAWAQQRHSLPVVGAKYRDTLRRLLEMPWPQDQPRLLLHIGLPKTGTTSIQETLLTNRERLLEQGILYPAAGLWGPGHAALASSYINPERRALGVYARAQDHHAILRQIRRETLEAGCERVIISAEALSDLNTAEIAQFVEDWSPHYAIEVVACLRRQDHLAEALIAQNGRVGNRQFFAAGPLDRDLSIYNSQAILRGWADLIGADRVTAFEYSTNGDVVADFLEATGLGQLEYEARPRRNERLHRFATDFILNHTTLQFGVGAYFQVLEELINYAAQHDAPVEYRYVLSPQDRAALLERYAAINEATAQQYFDGELFASVEPIDLDAPWSKFEGLDDEQLQEIEVHLRHAGIEESQYR